MWLFQVYRKQKSPKLAMRVSISSVLGEHKTNVPRADYSVPRTLKHNSTLTCAARSGFWLSDCIMLLMYGADSMFCISCGFSVICCNKLCIPGVLNILAKILFKKQTKTGLKRIINILKQCILYLNFSYLKRHMAISLATGSLYAIWLLMVNHSPKI